eukprot:2320169-Pyramimonas_sp.AAC.1
MARRPPASGRGPRRDVSSGDFPGFESGCDCEPSTEGARWRDGGERLGRAATPAAAASSAT